MLRLGQTESIYLKIQTRLEGNFQLVERRVLNTPARPCQEAESYSFTKCVLQFIERKVGCHLDWVGTMISTRQQTRPHFVLSVKAVA